MAGIDRVDHDKSSTESLLGLAGVVGFVLLERADAAEFPVRGDWAHSWKSLSAIGCAGLTFYGMRRGAPKLGAGLAGLMVGYELFLKRYPGKGGANVPLPRSIWAGSKAPWGDGRGHPDGGGPPPPPQSPCPSGMMLDTETQSCVPEPLPWPLGPRTGLSWEEVEKATPDLALAKRAAQAGWHAYLDLPGPWQMGYKFGMEHFG